MTVSVRWVLAQRALGLEVRAGAAGLDRQISFAHSTELAEPVPWLSGGELLLTTGLRLPVSTAERSEYLDGLHAAGVAALGFGTGLSFDTVPDDLVEAADRLGFPVVEVPLATPFAAIVKVVSNRLAEQQYEAVFRASRAQPRMTRAVVSGGAAAIVRELSTATSSCVVLLDQAWRTLEFHPYRVAPAVLGAIRSLASGGGTASSRVGATADGVSIAVQRIAIGSSVHGCVGVVGPVLTPIDHVLVGHAASLLALDFEKPARVQSVRDRVNSVALGVALAEPGDLDPVWSLLDGAADADGALRVLTIDADTAARADRVAVAVIAALSAASREPFCAQRESRVTAVLRGTDDIAFASALLDGIDRAERRRLRVGLSGPVPVRRLEEAAEQSRLAAASARAGAAPVAFGALVGGVLAGDANTRAALAAVGAATLAPLEDHDRRQGTALVASLRAFLDANGHWESAAAALGVHRHTLRNRIARAETIIGCDLDNARVRAELLLAAIARMS